MRDVSKIDSPDVGYSLLRMFSTKVAANFQCAVNTLFLVVGLKSDKAFLSSNLWNKSRVWNLFRSAKRILPNCTKCQRTPNIFSFDFSKRVVVFMCYKNNTSCKIRPNFFACTYKQLLNAFLTSYEHFYTMLKIKSLKDWCDWIDLIEI